VLVLLSNLNHPLNHLQPAELENNTQEEWEVYTRMVFASALFGVPDPELASSPVLLAFKDGFNITLSSQTKLLDVSYYGF
jgi:hypothetical protein